MMTLMMIQRRAFQTRLLKLLASLGALGLAPNLSARTGGDVLLATNAPANLDPSRYMVSEKLDGVRAVWDGQTLRFRSGRTVNAPAWFLAKLPKTALDGELWMGRGQFDAVSGVVRKTQPVDVEWQNVQYMVFEAPQGGESFAQRAILLGIMVQGAAWPQLQAVEQFKLPSHAALQARLKAVVAAGGEGLMLHLADAPYTTGRSDVLFKLKPVNDAEAVVIGHTPGKGKFEGMLGALDVKTPQGQRFKLGTGLSDTQRQNPPAIGSTVTYRYRDVTSGGKPRFASFLRMTAQD
jgi:DNA ligase 1